MSEEGVIEDKWLTRSNQLYYSINTSFPAEASSFEAGTIEKAKPLVITPASFMDYWVKHDKDKDTLLSEQEFKMFYKEIAIDRGIQMMFTKA